LLESEPDGIGPGDLAVLPHLPRFGTWTVVRIVGPYRYSIDDGRNWMGKPDFGHIVPVEIVSGPIPWRDAAIPPELGPDVEPVVLRIGSDAPGVPHGVEKRSRAAISSSSGNGPQRECHADAALG
jgi:hypothetical protein